MTACQGGLLPPDEALAGQPIPITGPLPSGVVFDVGLYGGTTSTLLTLQTELPLNPVGGRTGPCSGQLPFVEVDCSFPGGAPDYFQVAVWNSAYASPFLAEAACSQYVGFNHIFTMTPGTSIAYPSIINGGGSTWGAVGDEQPFIHGIVPEPSIFAISGLAAGVLWILRRHKS
ncbi:hypothetical protein SBV1_180033 [Verrucomicrobia bacterium]|nr:hypothetical protein SBV1_180033 [Verrucomicrobiota bacterium]